jgi:hypothetical protein
MKVSGNDEKTKNKAGGGIMAGLDELEDYWVDICS